MATTPDETAPLSSLITDNDSSPHTNGNTVSNTPGIYSKLLPSFLNSLFFI